jgi:hypothetical protein
MTRLIEPASARKVATPQLVQVVQDQRAVDPVDRLGDRRGEPALEQPHGLIGGQRPQPIATGRADSERVAPDRTSAT